MENALTAELRKLLLQSGADLMGVGDLRSLPEDQRLGLIGRASCRERV